VAARQHRAAPISQAALIEALAAAESWLATNVARIDRLNVFPVPDGDTGTNLLLTLRGTLGAIGQSGNRAKGSGGKRADGLLRQAQDDLEGRPLASVSEAALRAARGNSGVLLAAWLGGLDTADGESLDEGGVERWLAGGAAAARASVALPVEGTILTAMTAAAEVATAGGPIDRLAAAAAAAREAALASRMQMRLLAEAGVVDAGSLGFALLLDAIAAHLAGREPSPLPEGLGEVDPAWRAGLGDEAPAFGHCLRFSLVAPALGAGTVRLRLADLGEWVVVAGGGDRLSVHLHTEAVAAVLEAAAGLGSVDDITDEDMDAASAKFLASPAKTAVVAVASGDGWRRLFESFGAIVVNDAAAVVPAIEASAADAVIVLLNGAGKMASTERAAVLPLTDPATGLAAILAFDPEADVATNLDAMSRSAAAVTVLASSSDAVLDFEPPEGASLLTLYHGAGVTADQAETLAETLRLLYPGLEVEAVGGGQRKPDYLIACQA
jgi:dihydroxyacetone kinase-like predicted kinase